MYGMKLISEANENRPKSHVGSPFPGKTGLGDALMAREDEWCAPYILKRMGAWLLQRQQP